MLKTVLLNIVVDFFQDSLINRRFKQTICNLIAIRNHTKHTDFNDHINLIIVQIWKNYEIMWLFQRLEIYKLQSKESPVTLFILGSNSHS